MTDRTKTAIIGGGAAGLAAAIFAAENGADVTVFERNKKNGVKLRITGKGRCNVTNNCEVNEFLSNVVNNPKFLYAPLNFLSPYDTISWFENKLKVPLKTERGNRVFPISDNANDIANAMERYAKSLGVKFVCDRIQNLIIEDNKIKGVLMSHSDSGEKARHFNSVIVATGGLSYPKTGSDGDGYKFASDCGHTIIDPKPSLVPVETVKDISELSGLPLRNIVLKITETNSGKVVFSEMGEMLFTHFGLSGPLILSASAHMQDLGTKKYTALIDLKPALDISELDKRILSDFQKYTNKDFINSLSDLLPHVLIPYIVNESGIPDRTKVNAITKDQRKTFLNLLKSLPFDLKKFRPVDEAVVTSGGISVKEIDSKTMQSKIIDGLYFAGEVIDVDAYTGGFNLQIAFSTGALSGTAAACSGTTSAD